MSAHPAAPAKTPVALPDMVPNTGSRGPKVIGQRRGGPRLNRTAILSAAVVILFAASVLLGSYTVTIPDFFKILLGHLTGGERIPGVALSLLVP